MSIPKRSIDPQFGVPSAAGRKRRIESYIEDALVHQNDGTHLAFTKRQSSDDYTVGWISALPLEMAAAKAMLDEIHDTLDDRLIDDNVYTLGTMCGYNVVIACLPSEIYGTTSATTVAI